MDHYPPQPLADPIPDRAIELKLEQFSASHAPHSAAEPPHVHAELDHYGIAVARK